MLINNIILYRHVKMCTPNFYANELQISNKAYGATRPMEIMSYIQQACLQLCSIGLMHICSSFI